VRGLALHLERLRSNGIELFGQAPADVPELLARAVPGDDACTVRIALVSEDPALLAGSPVAPDVVVWTGPPRDAPGTPMRVRTAVYERESPHLKHRATHGLLLETRKARAKGFDDVLFVNRSGNVSEGATWNLLLHDGDTWVWPEADVLPGVTQQLVRRAMPDSVHRPVPLGQLPEHVAAFALNSSTPGRPLAAVDEHGFAGDSALAVMLEDLWSSNSPEHL